MKCFQGKSLILGVVVLMAAMLLVGRSVSLGAER